jgi:hypothetical protein
VSKPTAVSAVPSWNDHATLDLQTEWGTTLFMGLRCADRACQDRSTPHADRWRRNSGGTPVPSGSPCGVVESIGEGTFPTVTEFAIDLAVLI